MAHICQMYGKKVAPVYILPWTLGFGAPSSVTLGSTVCRGKSNALGCTMSCIDTKHKMTQDSQVTDIMTDRYRYQGWIFSAQNCYTVDCLYQNIGLLI